MARPAGEPTTDQGLWYSLRGSLNRNVLLLIAGGAIVNVPIGFIFVAMPVYLERLPTVPTALVGLFITITGATAVAFVVPIGVLADRFGRRLMLGLGGVLTVAALLLLSRMDSFEELLAIAGLLGLAEAFFFATWNALLADASTPETRNVVFGLSFFATSVSFALGSYLGVFADQAFQGGASSQAAYQPLFLAMGIAIVAAPLIVPLLRLPARARAAESGLLPRRSMGIIARFFVANILIGFGAGLIIPLFSLWFLLRLEVGESFTGPLFAVSSVVNAFAFLVAPTLAARVGVIRAVVAAQAVATILLFAMPFAASLAAVGLVLVSALYVARNALMNMAWPVMTAFLMGAVHPDERSAASGVVSASFRLPFAMSASLGSYLMAFDLTLPFYVTTVLYGLGTAAFGLFFRGYEAKRVEEPGGPETAEVL